MKRLNAIVEEKDEINERNFKCPDCEKCYSSGPALTNHRKTKHGYGNNGEKKNRGRPKRDEQNENAQISPISKFNNFFLDENRRPTSSGQSTEDKIITLDIVKAFQRKYSINVKMKFSKIWLK